MSAAAPVLAPPPGNPRFGLLDSMRAIAALSILVTHASGVSNFNVDNALGVYTSRLNFGVSIFFVLSGFLLYRPFVAARRQGRPGIGVGTFLRRRVLRIVPAYWVALAALIGYPGLVGTVHEPNLAPTVTVAPAATPAPGGAPALKATKVESTEHTWRFATFTQIYFHDSVVQGIGPAWTLCIEASFYLLLPFLALGIARLRPSVGSELAIIAGLGVAAIALRTILQASGGFFIAQNTLACYLDWFCWGMALAVLSVAWQGREQDSRVLRAVIRRAWLPWAAAALVFWFMATQLGLSRGFFALYTNTGYFGEHVLSALCAALLVLPAVFGDWAGGWPRRLLAARWLAWLGLVSYGVFLYHAPVMLELNRLGAQDWLPGSGLLSLAGSTAAVSVALAAASFYVVERPALRLKDRIGRRPARSRVAPRPAVRRAD